MNKTLKIFDAVTEGVFVVCVTLAAMHFNMPALLWWFVIVPILRAYRGK